ncbi:hypothetical protein BST27_29745 [Mycobacterium intermedium]|uniref:Integrase n=1 Tax=Mycobacterium intermedium TaxID=28445 RepID=A0A1E3SF92_MYCIE|nr:hypothetical protein [Mycobacterium intermedium]MCV6963933.1 hypothetical protein [Mycobacterium intermedium]ODR00248.1 hypothetical protein BHQ20_14115 [Mycobacterium intermedium]OPE47559.1 hypothetical protein BV508_21670 [Mycobacterium intermedium]ORA90415.1 hypothetical protein BST27_29745 [Mycobacterium intermedium]
MVLRNIIGRIALERGWELSLSSSVLQQYSKGDTTIKVRYLHTGAIWHAEWYRGGTRRDVGSQDPNKRDVVIAWLEE